MRSNFLALAALAALSLTGCTGSKTTEAAETYTEPEPVLCTIVYAGVEHARVTAPDAVSTCLDVKDMIHRADSIATLQGYGNDTSEQIARQLLVPHAAKMQAMVEMARAQQRASDSLVIAGN